MEDPTVADGCTVTDAHIVTGVQRAIRCLCRLAFNNRSLQWQFTRGVKFGSHDNWLKQPKKTLAYVKVLQHWAEKAQPPMLYEPCQLVECVWELRESIEPLTIFTNTEVFGNVKPLNWVRITPARMTEPAEPMKSWEWSHSWTRRGCTWGSFVATSNMERLTLTATTPAKGQLATSSLRVETKLESTSVRPWTPPPGFADITRSLWGDDSLCATIEIPLELTVPQGLLAGTSMATMISMWLQQDVVTGTSMNFVSLGVTPMVVDHPMPALEGWEDLESD